MPRKPSTLGQRLAALRGKRGLTQRALADAAGTTQATVSRLEAGRHDPERLELGTVLRLAAALGVPPAELVG